MAELMMKIYPNLLPPVANALEKILIKKVAPGKAIENLLSAQKKWGARDRRFATDLLMNVIRNFRLLQTLGGEHSDFLTMVGISLILQGYALPDMPAFHHLYADVILEKARELSAAPEIRYSIPDWLFAIGKAELGEKWEQELKFLHQPPEVILRANLLKISTQNLREELQAAGVEIDLLPVADEALVLKKRKGIEATASYKNGHFEFQDVSSQFVSRLLSPEPGMTVIDACAGAGGKTLHLGALMKNQGTLVAMDVHEDKLQRLHTRCGRAGLDIVRTIRIRNEKELSPWIEKADRLLLDVPCSGLGVLRRKPATKWFLDEEELQRLLLLQRKILTDYSQMVSVGGIMVYATCSILPSENQDQIAWFLDSHPNFEIEEEHHLWPSHGYDGFYAVRLKKNGC